MNNPTSTERTHACMVKLLPPRPTFHRDASDFERTVMRDHGAYWSANVASGLVVAFGPVIHPDGAFGIGLLRAVDDAEVRDFLAHDPAITTLGLGVETYPMPSLLPMPHTVGNVNS